MRTSGRTTSVPQFAVEILFQIDAVPDASEADSDKRMWTNPEQPTEHHGTAVERASQLSEQPADTGATSADAATSVTFRARQMQF